MTGRVPQHRSTGLATDVAAAVRRGGELREQQAKRLADAAWDAAIGHTDDEIHEIVKGALIRARRALSS